MNARGFRTIHLLNVALAANTWREGPLAKACDLAEQAFNEAIQAAYEDAARIADVWTNSKADPNKSDNLRHAQLIAVGCRTAGEKISDAIRARAKEKGR